MITRDNLPKNYKPFDTLTICSNVLKNGAKLVAVDDVIPLLIGKGDKPKIWLQAITGTEMANFITIIDESIPSIDYFRVYEESDTLYVKFSDEIILSVKLVDENSAIVEKLDLRRIGLDIYGDASSLTVGKSTFSGNSMGGTGTLVGFRKGN